MAVEIINSVKNQPRLIEFMCEARQAFHPKKKVWFPDFKNHMDKHNVRIVSANGQADQSAQGLNKAVSIAINEYCVNLQAKGVPEGDIKIVRAQLKQSVLVVKAVPEFGELRSKKQLELWKEGLNLIPADEIKLD